MVQMAAGCERMGCRMEISSVAQQQPRAFALQSRGLASLSCCPRNLRKAAAATRRVSQRMQPQALAFGGLAPADLHTELEALERSQGISQVWTIFAELPHLYKDNDRAYDIPIFASQAEAKVQSELLTLSEAQQIAAKR